MHDAQAMKCVVCTHSLGRHDRKALNWPVNADPMACTVWGCNCPRFQAHEPHCGCGWDDLHHRPCPCERRAS